MLGAFAAHFQGQLDNCKALPYNDAVIRSFRSKGLRRFAEHGDSSKLSVQNPDRIRRILLALNVAKSPDAMNVPGFRLYALKGQDRPRPACGRRKRKLASDLCLGRRGCRRRRPGGLSLMSNSRLVRGLKPMHPGEMLREDVLPALGKSKTEIARLLGVSRQTLYDILDEKQPVTPGMALRFGKLLGNGPDLWINLQRAYDLVIAERDLAGKLKKIPTLTAA